MSIAIYIDGEKILKHKIKSTSGDAQIGFVKELLDVFEKRIEYFKAKTPIGIYGVKRCQLMYDYRKELRIEDEELYECFDSVFMLDRVNFIHPKSLYTYFSLAVDLYTSIKKPIEEVFDKYDVIIEKIEEEIKNYSEKLNLFINKEEDGVALTKKEESRKKAYQDYLKTYALITKNIDIKVGVIADCKNLIPLNSKGFEENKTNAIWLKRAVSRMHNKECTEAPLYEKLVKAYDALEPSADTKYFVAILLIQKGKTGEATEYLKQAFNLESDAFKKAKYAERSGKLLKKFGSYSKARNYFRKALKLNPSNGNPHLAIAAMYAESAKNCGDTNFDKRGCIGLRRLKQEKQKRTLRLLILQKNGLKFMSLKRHQNRKFTNVFAQARLLK
ncbi:MAG: tetratricopeptide repeat protein [Jejuia sp.]